MAELGCSTSATIAFDFLVGKGLRDFQAAGVVGNLQQESGLDPRLDVLDSNKLPSRGIAMWQPPRWANLLAFAANVGRDPWSLDLQLDFLWHELPNFGLAQLSTSTTLEDATIVFQNNFEKPKAALAHTDRRIALARLALDCHTTRPPLITSRAGLVAAAAGVGALVAAAGYGIYRVLTARKSEPRPEPEPRPRPIFPPPRPIPRRFAPPVFRRIP